MTSQESWQCILASESLAKRQDWLIPPRRQKGKIVRLSRAGNTPEYVLCTVSPSWPCLWLRIMYIRPVTVQNETKEFSGATLIYGVLRTSDKFTNAAMGVR
jgi:hypothetical protein